MIRWMLCVVLFAFFLSPSISMAAEGGDRSYDESRSAIDQKLNDSASSLPIVQDTRLSKATTESAVIQTASTPDVITQSITDEDTRNHMLWLTLLSITIGVIVILVIRYRVLQMED